MGAAEHVYLQPDGFQFAVPAAEGLAQRLRLAVQLVQVVVSLLQNEGCRLIVLLRLLCGGGELFQGVQPDGNLHTLQFALQFQILLGLLGLLPEGFQLQLQLGNFVTDAQQVVLGVGKLAFGFFLAVAVLGDTGCFLKDFPTVAAFQGKNLVDTALADIGVAFPAQAGIHEHFVDVPQAGGLLVDVIFAVTGAVIAAGDHDLVGIVAESPVCIVQSQGGFRKAHGRPLLGAAENHVLHFRAPEGLGALLAHDPEDGIGDVGLTGAVGTDDGGNVIAKSDQRFVREGLEALKFQ